MKIKNLSYKHHKQAPYFFKDFSFDLPPGQMHALHGKNGVGKSVLLNVLAQNVGKDAIIDGEVHIQNAYLMNQKFDQMLACKFTVADHLQFSTFGRFPKLFNKMNHFQTPSYLHDLFDKFHIQIDLPVSKLSGGQRQILALMMILQKNPDLLLLDEPTAALDEQNAIMVFDFLSSLKDVTMLIVCHNKDLIHTYANGQHLHLDVNSDGVRFLQANDNSLQFCNKFV